MGKKTMKFVRRRKWTRSHRLMGLVQEPSSLFSSMKDLNASRTKRKSSATSSVSSGIVNSIKKKSVKKVTISSSRSSISTTHGAIDHEVADADDEDDNDDGEDNDDENDGDNNDDIYDENDEDGMQNNQYPGSLSNPSDPNLGVRPPGTGTDDSNPTLYRQLVRKIP